MNVKKRNVRRDKSLLNMTESIALFNHCPGLQSGVDEALINLGFSQISFSELAALFLEQIYTLFIVRLRYPTRYRWLAMTADSGLFAIDTTLAIKFTSGHCAKRKSSASAISYKVKKYHVVCDEIDTEKFQSSASAISYKEPGMEAYYCFSYSFNPLRVQ